MTGLDLFSIQEEIKTYLAGAIPFHVESGGVPDATTVRQVNGTVEPYVVMRFADSMPSARDTSFGGARYDGLYSYVDCLCVAGGRDDTNARRLGSLVNETLTGFTTDNIDELGKSFGGGTFYIASENSRPIAWVGIASFRFSLNMTDVGA
jgi:hypothetical protein